MGACWSRLRLWLFRKKPDGEASPPSPRTESPGQDAAADEVFQRAVERLLEDEALTADLVDAAAEHLLAWGKERVQAILREEAGATEDHPRLAALRQQMRAIARRIGELPPEKQAEALQALLAEMRGQRPEGPLPQLST